MIGCVIKNVDELLKYAKPIETKTMKTIEFEFEEGVVIDIPETVYMRYIEDSEGGSDIQEFSFTIIGGSMKIVNFPFKLHTIYATDLSIMCSLRVERIIVSDTLTGHRISADSIRCRNMLVDYVDCRNIDCKNALGADILVVGDMVFEKVYAKHVRKEKSEAN